tara:strand:- start:207 stop:3224 length:3018 start_codon:yes stop_codon:yes gene_type:complete
MTDSFTDVKIIEANRLHSEESKAGNQENTSLWTNNLQDILHLEPNDKVSIYGAFVSERGAGQNETVEIKGVELGEFHKFSYVNLSKTIVSPDRIDNNLPSGASKIIFQPKINIPYAIRDDTLRFTMSYYMVANTQNSLHLPRRWMFNKPGGIGGDFSLNFSEGDNATVQGATLTKPLVSNASSGTKVFAQTNAFYDCIPVGAETLQKPKNDNGRYTIMVRDKTFFTIAGMEETNVLPGIDFRDPEQATYYPFKELKEIVIPAGFNSADYIATEITRQLQNITNDVTLYQRNDADESFPIYVSKVLESETYKVFNTGSVSDNTVANFKDYFNLSGTANTVADKTHRTGWKNASGFEWLRQYQFVGCKYPELYETGRLLNRAHNRSYQGILGAKTYNRYEGGLGAIVFDIPYEKARCDEFKAFFDSQKLYPEIIENLNSANASGYQKGNNLQNTRYCHINRWNYQKQSLSLIPSEDDTQLGWGGYYYPRTYNPVATDVQLLSFLLCLFFDESQSETFYSNPDSDIKEEYTYGCLGKVDNRIAIYPSRHINNGWVANQPLWEGELFKPYFGTPSIEAGRKIGFDLHFNAPGMYYMLPLSGWTPVPDPTFDVAGEGGSFLLPNASQDNKGISTVPANQLHDLNNWKKHLYLGADNPTLNWDGTNFSFSNFHTSLNRGNDYSAGNPVLDALAVAAPNSWTARAPDINAEDVVYKINPRTEYMDWSPDRTPYDISITGDDYSLNNITEGVVQIKLPRTNHNYEKWTIYDMLSGIFIEDFGVPENLWSNSLWGILGFSYKQFHTESSNRLTRIQSGNANQLSYLTTNAEVFEGDTKIYSTNWAGIPMYNNMITTPVNQISYDIDASPAVINHWTQIFPEIIHKTQSIKIIAENLPTRMIRGYYTIRSNILEGTPFIGGKVNNTNMPIIGIVDKINGDGDFYFGQESSLKFTITKPLRLASLSVSIHDPDGSYARTSEQSTILFKVEKTLTTTFNIAQQMLEENKNNPILQRL